MSYTITGEELVTLRGGIGVGRPDVTVDELLAYFDVPTTEEIQDLVGAMVAGNTETGIAVTYQDSDGTLDFVADIRGTVGTVDNALVRANGTGGTTLQGQTSGGPVLNDDGSVVNTAQPAFLVYLSSGGGNQTGAGTDAQIGFNAEAYDQGGDVSSGTFTAPVDGKYPLQAQVRLSSIGAAADDARMRIITSNRTFINAMADTNDVPADYTMNIVVTADMDAGDTAVVDTRVQGMAGDTVNIGGGSPLLTFFSGFLAA